MPVNVVKSKAEEKLWSRAKSEADKGGYKGKSKWKVTMSIFKNMKEAGVEPATQDEVDAFVKAAMDRYAEIGIPPDLAEKLFASKMANVAELLGIPAIVPTPAERIIKAAVTSLVKRGMSEQDAQVQTVNIMAKLAHDERIATVKKAVTEGLTPK